VLYSFSLCVCVCVCVYGPHPRLRREHRQILLCRLLVVIFSLILAMSQRREKVHFEPVFAKILNLTSTKQPCAHSCSWGPDACFVDRPMPHKLSNRVLPSLDVLVDRFKTCVIKYIRHRWAEPVSIFKGPYVAPGKVPSHP
jgi:hypothetical protein